MAKPSERNRQVVRQWEILTALGERPATIGELAEASGRTTRTIRRDLEALEEAGFPLWNDKDEDGSVRWHLMTKAMTPRRAA